jgi:hypothetical protein
VELGGTVIARQPMCKHATIYEQRTHPTIEELLLAVFYMRSAVIVTSYKNGGNVWSSVFDAVRAEVT